jgi:hypothetical protein
VSLGSGSKNGRLKFYGTNESLEALLRPPQGVTQKFPNHSVKLGYHGVNGVARR